VIAEVELNYYGQHISKSDPFHVEEFFKGLYGLAITYPIALTLSKLSLLALYWRIFRGTKGKLPIQIAAGLNIAWMIAAVCIGSLTPVSAILTAVVGLCRIFQLYTCSRILGPKCPKPMH